MLDETRNELLTRVGPGTRMGEDLVLYKDLSGTFGLVDRHCPATSCPTVIR
jgi:hypothetical protein